MPLKLSDNPKDNFIEYKKGYKKWSGIALISIFIFIALVIVIYITFFRKLHIFEETFIPFVLSHITSEMFDYTELGFLYTFFFGGLFFLFIPLEAFYIAVLNKGIISTLHILFMTGGILISYSLNYFIGLRFSGFSKKFISPKKFYRTKSIINKYGKLAIFFFNLIGVGSQQVTFVLGVFRYNKTRLFVFAAAGQIVKYTLITIVLTQVF